MSKKRIFIVVMATALVLVLSSFLPMILSQTNNFTLPCTINTTGNAWNGDIAFDLSNTTVNALVVINTDGTVLSVRESAGSYGPAYNIAPDTLMFEGEPQVGEL